MADKQKRVKPYKQMLNELFEYIPQEVQVIHKTKYRLEMDGIYTTTELCAKRSLRIDQNEEYIRLKEGIDKVTQGKQYGDKKLFNNFYDAMEPSISLGDPFLEIVSIQAINAKNGATKLTNWKPREGVVTLVNIGKSNSKEFNRLVECSLKLLEKNQHWKDKVELVNIYSEKQLVDVVEEIKGKQWNQVNHYWMNQECYNQSLTLKSLDTTKFRRDSFVVLLNQYGQFVYKGQTDQIFYQKQEQLMNDEVAKLGQNGGQYLMEQKQYTLLTKKEFKMIMAKSKAEIRWFLSKLDLPQKGLYKFSKAKILTKEGKVPIKRTKVRFSYIINIKYKPNMEEFIYCIEDSLTPEYIIFKPSMFIDEQAQREEMKQLIKQKAEEFGIHINIYNIRDITYTYNSEDETLSCNNNSKIQIETSETPANIFLLAIPAIQELFFNRIGLVCNDILQAIQLKFEIAGQLKVGDDFIPIEGYNIAGQAPAQITHKKGQILVLHYWERCDDMHYQYLGVCQSLKQNNKDIWGDQVRFVSLSKGKERKSKAILQKVKGIDDLEIQFATDSNQYIQLDNLLYKVTNRPYFVIVDKYGKIRYCGEYKQMESIIGKLLNEKQMEQQQKQELVPQEIVQLGKVTTQQIAQLIQFLDNSKDKFKGMKDQNVFDFKLNLIGIYESNAVDSKLIRQDKLELVYQISSDKEKQVKLNAILGEIFKIVPKQYFTIDDYVAETFDIPFPGKECSLCKVELSDQVPQYYSQLNNNFVCVHCAEYEDEETFGFYRFKLQDKLIFINAPLTDMSVLKGIDTHKLGKLVYVEGQELQRNISKAMCKSCGKKVLFPRFISITARPGRIAKDGYCDYCSNCFLILKNKHSEEAQAIINKNANDRMCTDGLFIRILIEYGYYDF